MQLKGIVSKKQLVGIFGISLGSVFLLTSPSQAIIIKADYQFQNNLSSSIPGAPDLGDLGTTNSFGTAIVDSQATTVFNFAQQTGLNLSTNGLIPNDQYSVVLLFSLEQVSGWRRIVEFKNLLSDNGLYNLDSNLNFYPVASGNSSPIAANSYVQVALTRDSSSQVTGYVDGIEQFNFNDINNYATISSDNILTFFQDDTQAPGEASSGSVARIRLYDDALSTGQIANLDRLPAAAVPWETDAIPIVVSGVILGLGLWAKRRFTVPK